MLRSSWRRNENLAAVGLFTGRKGRGIVILDVDAHLGGLKRKWGRLHQRCADGHLH